MCGVTGAIIATVASTAVSAASTIQQGQQQAALAKYNAKMTQDQYNAQALVVRQKAKRDIASQTVALGAQGTRVDTGSPLLLLSESARNAELNAQSVQRTGQMQANVYNYQAQSAVSNSYLGAGAELLSGAAQVASLASK